MLLLSQSSTKVKGPNSRTERNKKANVPQPTSVFGKRYGLLLLQNASEFGMLLDTALGGEKKEWLPIPKISTS